MKNIFQPERAEEIQNRLNRLTEDSKHLWGSMNVAQMLAHCSKSIKMALGEVNPPRVLIGRLLGRIIKPMALGNDKSMRKNSPTVPGLVTNIEYDFVAERDQLRALIQRFIISGPTNASKHPHSFFGRLKPEEWAILMYKHLDHHLRQFGV